MWGSPSNGGRRGHDTGHTIPGEETTHSSHLHQNASKVLPALANKNAGCPVEFELPINNKSILFLWNSRDILTLKIISGLSEVPIKLGVIFYLAMLGRRPPPAPDSLRGERLWIRKRWAWKACRETVVFFPDSRRQGVNEALMSKLL